MSGDTADDDQRLSAEEAQSLIKAIEEVEREEANKADAKE